MAKNIVGVYETPAETISAIENLKNNGYEKESIAVITNRSDSNYLENRTGAEVERTKYTPEDESVMEQLMDFFTSSPYEANGVFSVNADVSETELNKYSADLNEGKYLLAVDAIHENRPLKNVY
ncbi:general stress protein [Peribacillus sp. B-H-3]|uniref:general stress protein n=1 Tax=Peribacillus sp. B-H-3 TaxID=3400420 RepID=UPI003B015EBF